MGMVFFAPGVFAAEKMMSSVLLFESELADKISIVAQDSRRDANHVLMTKTVFKNNSSQILHLYVQTFFKDAKGATQEVSPKKEIVLGPLAEQTYVALSAKTHMDRFVVYLQTKKENPNQLTHQTPIVLEMGKKFR